MQLLLLLGELHLLVAELTGAVARARYLGQPVERLTDLRDRLAAEHARAGYSGREAAELLGVTPAYARRMFPDAEKEGRTLAIAPARLYREALVYLTMALNNDGDGVRVPDNCAARMVSVNRDDLPILIAEIKTAACRDKTNHRLVGLARFLVGLQTVSDSAVPLKNVAALYGAMLSGRPWDMSYRSPLARHKLDVLGITPPPGVQRFHLRIASAPADMVLALGRNTWTVQQSNPRALPPTLNTFLPGIEKRLALAA